MTSTAGKRRLSRRRRFSRARGKGAAYRARVGNAASPHRARQGDRPERSATFQGGGVGGDALIWRVERACAAAWPARVAHRESGWMVGVSGGGSRRSNSASATAPDVALDMPTLHAIQRRYRDADQPTIVRLTDATQAAGALLDAAGFAAPEGRTRTLLRLPAGHTPPGAVIVTAAPDAAWRAARQRLSPSSAADHAAIPSRVTAPAAFARVMEGAHSVAIGYAALTDGIAVIESVATDPAARRRGHASAIVAALLGWAARGGAAHVALQVEEANAAARALYDQLGFATDLYGYHYRRSARCPTFA